MTQHTIKPFQHSCYLHVFIREPWPWEHELDVPEAGCMLDTYLNKNEEPPTVGGSKTLLYSEKISIPIPSFNPVSKRLEAVDNEIRDIRQEYYNRLHHLEETKKKILSLPSPDETEENSSGTFISPDSES